jgi:hypothetical protein
MSLKTRCALENMKSSYRCLPSLHDILRVFLFYPKVKTYTHVTCNFIYISKYALGDFLFIYPSSAYIKTEGIYTSTYPICFHGLCVCRESFILHVFIYLFVHLSACLFMYLSTVCMCMSFHPSIGWPIYLFIFLFVYLFVCLFLDW